jgi:hypothetical protein
VHELTSAFELYLGRNSNMIETFRRFPVMLLPLLLIACNQGDDITVTISAEQQQLTAENAVEFVANSEQQLSGLGQEAERMAWVYSNFITEDTEKAGGTGS